MVDFGMDPIYIKDFVVIAMAGYFTAIGKAPLTAIILVTEMVGSLNHLMPLGLGLLLLLISSMTFSAVIQFTNHYWNVYLEILRPPH